jgi:UDP-N-acetylmuramoyl-tripeptide--D-alanyl-D-alanine ligase
LEIAFLLFISLFVGIMQLPVFLMKNAIEKKAGIKIRQLKNLTVIGVTGSYGKTSTKEFLYTLLSSKYNCLKTEGNINTKIGIAQFVLKNLKENHRVFICEMGAYRIGEIKDICEMVKPKIGILTGINQQHVDLFGSQENIIKAKYELIESLPKDGMAIFNGDNNYCRELYQKTNLPKMMACSTEWDLNCEIQAKNIGVEKDFIYFDAIDKNGKSDSFKVNVFGSQNIQNILMAILTAKEMGMSEEEIANAVQSIKPEQGGMKCYRNKNGISIIDSSYSANPDGVVSALEYLKTWPQKKVIIMPSLIELGLASSEIHKNIGRAISQVCDLAIITTKEHFADIVNGKNDNIFLIENAADIANKIRQFASEGDVVLLEGRIPPAVLKLLL